MSTETRRTDVTAPTDSRTPTLEEAIGDAFDDVFEATQEQSLKQPLGDRLLNRVLRIRAAYDAARRASETGEGLPAAETSAGGASAPSPVPDAPCPDFADGPLPSVDGREAYRWADAHNRPGEFEWCCPEDWNRGTFRTTDECIERTMGPTPKWQRIRAAEGPVK